jgi:hypothetical protein
VPAHCRPRRGAASLPAGTATNLPRGIARVVLPRTRGVGVCVRVTETCPIAIQTARKTALGQSTIAGLVAELVASQARALYLQRYRPDDALVLVQRGLHDFSKSYARKSLLGEGSARSVETQRSKIRLKVVKDNIRGEAGGSIARFKIRETEVSFQFK